MKTVNELTAIRELTDREIDEVSGASRVRIGQINVGVQREGIQFIGNTEVNRSIFFVI